MAQITFPFPNALLAQYGQGIDNINRFARVALRQALRRRYLEQRRRSVDRNWTDEARQIESDLPDEDEGSP